MSGNLLAIDLILHFSCQLEALRTVPFSENILRHSLGAKACQSMSCNFPGLILEKGHKRFSHFFTSSKQPRPCSHPSMNPSSLGPICCPDYMFFAGEPTIRPFASRICQTHLIALRNSIILPRPASPAVLVRWAVRRSIEMTLEITI